MAPSLGRRALRSPMRQATGTRTAAPTAQRLQARNAGGKPASTASLMKRYGMPQRVETAAKAAQERAVIVGGRYRAGGFRLAERRRAGLRGGRRGAGSPGGSGEGIEGKRTRCRAKR